MSISIADFLKAALTNTVLLLPLILGFVTWTGKALGVQGQGKFIVSMAAGFVLGVAAQIASVGLPVAFPDIFALFLFGLVPGLVASGCFDVAKDVASKTPFNMDAWSSLNEGYNRGYADGLNVPYDEDNLPIGGKEKPTDPVGNSGIGVG